VGDEPSSRDRFKEGLAGNDEVEQFIKSFPGRGATGDDSSPTPAPDALKLFKTADGLAMDLVAAEPDVMQPLFLHFDARGRMWVVEYLQYPFPAGLKVVRYDQHLRAVFDQVPAAPPHHVHGADKIAVFEDADGDGVFESHKDVITGLNIATSVAVGGGGIWVLNPPYLLFYPDADGDDVPDGDPVVHLSGFGLEDTHSVANSLTWGPDGWLYGANGSTTTATVNSAATKNVRFSGQCIWRYHPKTQVFEIYGEGGGNTFSLEFDSKGRVFSGTNFGGTRGMFYPQGSYGIKGWAKHGPLTNPYAFGWFEHMKHEGDGDRFPQTFCIYEANSLPVSFRGDIISANALQNRVWASHLSADGSTYKTVDLPPIVTTSDHWFRPVDIKVGPDGGVYMADWYDSRLTHVDPRDNWHKTTGRIYRLRGSEGKLAEKNVTDLSKMTNAELLELLTYPAKWQRMTAVRLLSERVEDSLRPELTRRALAHADGALESLWVLNRKGWFDFELAGKLLDHPDADVRRWAVRLLGDARVLDAPTAEHLRKLAEAESYVQVRSQLASSAKRFEARYAMSIIRALLGHSEDQSDPHMPLLLWWAIEGHCGEERGDVLAAFRDKSIWEAPMVEQVIASRLAQRFALEAVTATDNPKLAASSLEACADLFDSAPNLKASQRLMAGFLEVYSGRDMAALPDRLRTKLGEIQAQGGESDIVLKLKLGQPEAIEPAIAVMSSDATDRPTRLAVIEFFGRQPNPKAQATLINQLGASAIAIKRGALQALMAYDDPSIGDAICQRWHSTLPDEQDLHSIALRVLASRVPWAKALLKEVAESRIKPELVPLDVVQQMRLHGDAQLDALLEKYWGRTRSTPAEKREQINRLAVILKSPASGDDAIEGHAVFKKHCATCHTLFGEGGQTGPNLTGYERNNLDFLLVAVVDPSAGIREEFTQFAIATKDGRVLNGLIDQQTPTTVTLRGANNQTTQIDRSEIEQLQALRVSIMPDGLIDKLTNEEIRNLFAYVRSRTPVAAGAGGGK
jgi:putative membrane-bound dehydrogenase-like protein